jgi:hypothetical protein
VRPHQAKRRDSAVALRLVIALSVAASGVGCSLVDGWGGLEGGSSGGHGSSGGTGSSGGNDGSATGNDGGDAGPVVVGAACGNTRCDSSQNKGCCVVRQPGGSGGGGVCEQATACTGQGNAFLACDDSSECASGSSCCYEYTGGTSTCTTMCQGLVMCAGAGGHCPSGACTQAVGLLPTGYFICM